MTADTRTNNRWLILVIACLAQFMVVLDATIVNVALPSIQRGLHFSGSALPWVVNAYTLVFGGFLLLGGRASDLLGRKRLFAAGIAVFAFASLLNGLAQSPTMLIVGRGLQGLGGALLSPAALSIITTTFTETGERTRALGVWSAIAAGGGAVGLLLGGVLTDLASWPWIFIVNVPVGLAALALTTRFVPESRANLSHRTFDFLGAVIERRSKAPLVRLGIFRIRTLAVADLVLLLVASGMFGMFFFASLYVQDILGYSPLRAGLAFLPITVGIVIGAGIAQQLIRRAGVLRVSVLGISLATAGLALLTQLPVHGSYLGNLLVGLFPMSIGMGLVFVPITLLGTGGVNGDDAGLASGLFNTAQQVGGSLGLAILATLAASQTSHLLHGTVTPAMAVAARVSGYHVAFGAAAAMLGAGALILALALRRRHVESIGMDPAPLTAAA
jgi:predicted MFS family arabinose efflux permease